MTALEFTFPDDWRLTPRPGRGHVITCAAAHPSGGLRLVASLRSRGPRRGAGCRITVGRRDDAELPPVARDAGGARDDVVLELPVGRVVRSTLLPGETPERARVRYALALPHDRVAVLEFETGALDRLTDEVARFEAIVRSGRIV